MKQTRATNAVIELRRWMAIKAKEAFPHLKLQTIGEALGYESVTAKVTVHNWLKNHEDRLVQ